MESVDGTKYKSISTAESPPPSALSATRYAIHFTSFVSGEGIVHRKRLSHRWTIGDD